MNIRCDFKLHEIELIIKKINEIEKTITSKETKIKLQELKGMFQYDVFKDKLKGFPGF